MFQITSKLDYGLILLRSLALHFNNGPQSLKTIAEENNLPYHYLAQIIIPLKRAGIVIGFEGVKGGYVLSREPEAISLKEITTILASDKKLNRCLLADHRVCKLKKTCSMSPWWMHFNERFQTLIKDIKLADLI